MISNEKAHIVNISSMDTHGLKNRIGKTVIGAVDYPWWKLSSFIFGPCPSPITRARVFSRFTPRERRARHYSKGLRVLKSSSKQRYQKETKKDGRRRWYVRDRIGEAEVECDNRDSCHPRLQTPWLCLGLSNCENTDYQCCAA